jgi:hypothetical protein
MGSYSNPSLMSRIQRILAGHHTDLPSDRSRSSRQLQRHLDETEVDSLLHAHSQGETIDQLATTFGIHRTAVMAHLKRHGAPRRTHIVTKNIDEAIRLYENGWSLALVRERFGVNAKTARRA